MDYVNLKELYAGFMACSTFFYMGFSYGFSTEYIYQINKKAIKLSGTDISWIGGSGSLLSFVGCLISGYLMDRFGRKSLFYCTYGFHFVGWMIISKTRNLLLGRILTSFAIGLGYSSMIYVAEIIQPKYRGTSLTFTSILEMFGILIIYLTEYYVSGKAVSLLLSIFASILFIGVFFMPETPYWYMMKKKKDKAMKSLFWLRNGNKALIDFEIQEIENNLDDINKIAPTFIKTIFDVRWWKILLIFSFYAILTELVGIDMIIPYMVQFFDKFNLPQMDSRIMSIIFIFVALVGAIITAFIVDKFERVPLVKFANLVNIILLLISGICAKYINSSFLSIISLVCFGIYSTTASISASTVPWTIISESLPTEFRATIFATLSTEFTIIYFLIVKFFPTLLEILSVDYIIYLLAFFSFLNYIYVHIFVKETKGIILPGKQNS